MELKSPGENNYYPMYKSCSEFLHKIETNKALYNKRDLLSQLKFKLVIETSPNKKQR